MRESAETEVSALEEWAGGRSKIHVDCAFYFIFFAISPVGLCDFFLFKL